MKSNNEIVQAIIDQGILPLYYHDSAEKSVNVLRALYKAGVRVLEYTNRGPAALENFKLLKQAQHAEMPGLKLGIGTIKTSLEADLFIEAGADFIVSPIVNAGVAKACAHANLLWIPGCMTPTEISLAQDFLAPLVKIFPANILGPAFISSIKDLFPGQLFIPTGGVEVERENITTWFKAGVCAVGMGSKLITKSIIDRDEYELLYKSTKEALELVSTCK